MYKFNLQILHNITYLTSTKSLSFALFLTRYSDTTPCSTLCFLKRTQSASKVLAMLSSVATDAAISSSDKPVLPSSNRRNNLHVYYHYYITKEFFWKKHTKILIPYNQHVIYGKHSNYLLCFQKIIINFAIFLDLLIDDFVQFNKKPQKP